MSARTFYCTLCGHALEGDDTWRGRTIRCPACEAEVVIPGPAGAAEGTSAEADVAAAADDDERTIFAATPVPKAYSAELALGFLLLALAVVAALRLFIYGPGWLGWVLGLPLLLAGLFIVGRVWVRCKSLDYRLTTQRLFIQRGLIAKRYDEIELFRVKDVVVQQNLLQRLIGCGTIVVISTDDTCPRLEMSGLDDPVPLKEEIRSCYKRARAKVGLRATEFIAS